jgi:hypothetical protein
MTSLLDGEAVPCFCCQKPIGEDGFELDDEGYWLSFCSVGCLSYYIIKNADQDTLRLLTNH